MLIMPWVVIIPLITGIPVECMEITMYTILLAVLLKPLLPIKSVLVFTILAVVGITPAIKNPLVVLPSSFGILLVLRSIRIRVSTASITLILSLLCSCPLLLEGSMSTGMPQILTGSS